MESKHLTLPAQKTDEYGYGLAYQLAREKLASIDDLEQQCVKSGTRYIDSQKAIAIEYLSQPYLIALASGDVSPIAGSETVTTREKILMLHYFNQAKGTPPSHRTVTYKELREGINYFPVFYKRAIKPLVTYFGREPGWLFDIAKSMGGHKADYGDAAVTIDAFRRVPITLVLWKGDDEFAPEGNIMFDSNVSDYLTNDDIHALCETTAWKLVKRLKAGGDNPGTR